MGRVNAVVGSAAALWAVVGAGSAGSTGDAAELERAFTRAWARSDGEAVAASVRELEAFAERHPESARAHYLLGLADLCSVLRTNTAPDDDDVEHTLAVLERATERLTRAAELDPGEADACAAAALCAMQPFYLGSAGPDQPSVLGGWIARARSADPERTSVRLLEAFVAASSGLTSDETVEAAMDRFAELAADVREELRRTEREPDFWELFAPVMAARALVFAPRPRPGEAAEIVDALLEVAPDLRMATHFLRPFVTVREPLPRERWRDLAWEELGGELELDAAAEGFPDAVAVRHHRDGDGASWFRIELAAPPPPDAFGINLVVDADGSPATGTPWWGGNGAFVFDRLVSAWVARDGTGRYRGAVGVTDDASAKAGEMTNLGDGTVGFAVDVEGTAFVLRVPAGVLGERARFLVAVGSNAQWSDDVPNAGSLGLGK